MDTSHLDRPATATTGGRQGSDSAPSASGYAGRRTAATAPERLLPGLWIATAVALVVAPFLTQLRLRNQSPEVDGGFSVDGWGRWDGVTISHGTRVGILFAAIAGLLVLAAVATFGRRGARWPVWLGLSASAMAVTAGAVQLADLDASRSLWETDTTTATFGPGAGLVVVFGVSATIAAVLSILRLRQLAPATTPRASLAGRWPFVLSGLWIAAAVGLAVAPFLTVRRVDAAETGTHIRADGWDEATGSLGVPCTILALGLAVAAIALLSGRATAFPLHLGLISGAGAVVVGGFLLLRLEALSAMDHPPLSSSAGPGTLMVLTAGVLAAVTAGLALVLHEGPVRRQRASA